MLCGPDHESSDHFYRPVVDQTKKRPGHKTTLSPVTPDFIPGRNYLTKSPTRRGRCSALWPSHAQLTPMGLALGGQLRRSLSASPRFARFTGGHRDPHVPANSPRSRATAYASKWRSSAQFALRRGSNAPVMPFHHMPFHSNPKHIRSPPGLGVALHASASFDNLSNVLRVAPFPLLALPPS